MDVIKNRQFKRQLDIQTITQSIMNSEKFKSGEIKDKELILIIMSQTGLSHRTAAEYLQVAKFNIKNINQ
jgi:hypothetical protein